MVFIGWEYLPWYLLSLIAKWKYLSETATVVAVSYTQMRIFTVISISAMNSYHGKLVTVSHLQWE